MSPPSSLPPLALPSLSLESHASEARLHSILVRLTPRDPLDYLPYDEPPTEHVVLDVVLSPPLKPAPTSLPPLDSLPAIPETKPVTKSHVGCTLATCGMLVPVGCFALAYGVMGDPALLLGG